MITVEKTLNLSKLNISINDFSNLIAKEVRQTAQDAIDNPDFKDVDNFWNYESVTKDLCSFIKYQMIQFVSELLCNDD